MSEDMVKEMKFDRKRYHLAGIKPERLMSPWWIGHIPFAFELVNALKPKSIVELGTYSGSSFFAFLQMVKHLELPTKCYGVDTWEGDIHMGRFKETLFQEASEYCKTNYPGMAELVRRRFNEAVNLFDDKSIDLLHIDGTHTYAEVSNDYHTWLPKVSDRGVVLFHDTNVTCEKIGKAAANFGVKKFFDSVKGKYPHIEFKHCYGLGVLVVGGQAPGAVIDMVSQSGDPEFLKYFAMLGEKVSQTFKLQEEAKMGTLQWSAYKIRNFINDWLNPLKKSSRI